MLIEGKHYRTIWLHKDKPEIVQIIDQSQLPHHFVIEDLKTVNDVAVAIHDLHVRGAGLIGATAGYGMYIAAMEANSSEELQQMAQKLIAQRPTAVNLQWAVERQLKAMENAKDKKERVAIAKKTAIEIADEDADFCRRIGEHGVSLIEEISKKKNGEPVNILTHCNAGWLAFVDYGSATAPIYAAREKGIKVNVWVDETRPHNKGIRLTAFELFHENIPHKVIVDNVGGHLMQHGMVDAVIIGTDRTTYTGDVGNQIGTYLKALAAHDNNIPFYVCLPSSTFDWTMRDGVKEIPIEERDGDDTRYVHGLVDDKIRAALLAPEGSPGATYVFDVTPRKYITKLITERGIMDANEESILAMYPEKRT